jgi:hypothetical protein
VTLKALYLDLLSPKPDSIFVKLFLRDTTLKYKQLHHEAKHIDRLIDAQLHIKGGLFPTQEQLGALVASNYPDFTFENCGWHKIVFRNRSFDHNVVLKVGPHKSIESDHRVYKSVPEDKRHIYLARIFWHTKYCLLQEYGDQTNVSEEQLSCLREAVYKYGVFDVKAENVRWIGGKLRIIDANVTRIPLPIVLRKIDEVKPKLPKQLDTLIKKITKLLSGS